MTPSSARVKRWRKNNPEKYAAELKRRYERARTPEGRAHRRELYQRNLKHNRRLAVEKQRRYVAAHREERREYMRRYLKANRERINERARARRKSDPERYREAGRRYFRLHPERAREAQRRYWNRNRERCLSRNEEWARRNPYKKFRARKRSVYGPMPEWLIEGLWMSRNFRKQVA